MGVDLASYRLRIGLFNKATFKQTKTCILDVAIIVFYVTCGALMFIQAILLEQGIEPNPGPWTFEMLSSCVVTGILGICITLVILRIHRRKHNTNDRTNFALMCRLLLDVCAGLLREVLIAKTAPDSLAVTLQKIQNEIPNVYQNKLYPQGGFKGSYRDLDVSILCCVLRNIGKIPPHSKGWGIDPDDSDSSLSANIDRIRIQRNKGFAHLTTTCMSDKEFQEGWDVIKRCVRDIKNLTTIRTDYLAEMNRLKEEAISSETEHRYIEKFRELHDFIDKAFMVQKEALQEIIANRNKDRNELKTEKQRMMIKSAMCMVEQQSVESQYIETGAFHKAKDKLEKNGVLVIKGNTGDGKTRLAIQLLSWLMNRENRQAKRPIELQNFIHWEDIVAPKLNLAVFIDDVFHGNIFRDANKAIWENKQKYFKSTFGGDENIDCNFLIVTVRNEDFISLTLESDKVFQTQNIVDLSTTESMIEKEKISLLRSIQPSGDDFVPFSDNEIKMILKCAPPLGFPQCCALYRELSALHPLRVDFFRKPAYFIKYTLSKLPDGRCAALLYLFLCGGKVEKDLYGYSDQIDNEKLKASFDTKLLKDMEIPCLDNNEKKVEFIMESLHCMCGSLVMMVTEYGLRNIGEVIYFKFSHESIEETIALLYGEKTKVKFIQNCHCKSLHYITTSENTSNRIAIAPNNVEIMYRRLLRELECKQSTNHQCVAALDIWNDQQFLLGFFRWLDKQNIDNAFHLNWTTKDVHYYSDDGPNGVHFFSSFLVYVAHTNNVLLLNKLVERTPRDHPQLQCALFGLVRGGYIDAVEKVTEFCIIPTMKAVMSRSSNEKICGINVLHEACLFERVEIVKTLATKYPSLVQDRCYTNGLSTLHIVVLTGNRCLYDIAERFVLGNLSREERVERLSGLVDDTGRTVLSHSCWHSDHSSEMVLHLIHKYPELVSVRSMNSYHCLHCLALRSNKDLFEEFHTYLQTYYRNKGIQYDIKSILTNHGTSVFDIAKRGDTYARREMRDFLSQFWS